MKDKTKNILLIIITILFIFSCAFIFYLLNKDKVIYSTTSGKVIVASDSYVIVEGEDSDYLIKNTKGNYQVGDKIEFTYSSKNLKNEDNLKTIEIIDEELISSKLEEPKKEQKNVETNNKTKIEDNSNNSKIEKNETKTTSETINNNVIKENNTAKEQINTTNSTDSEVLTYLTNIKNDVKEKNIKDSVKSGFVSVVDFLFYNGTIKGHTFNELSNSAKLEVLSIAYYFDEKIDEYFPGYRESISNTSSKVYTNAKNEITETYLETAEIICKNDNELCNNAKSKFNILKKNFNLTWSLIKDIAGDGLSKLKNWYEIWREK